MGMSLTGNVIKNVFPPSVELKIYYMQCSQVVFTTSGFEPPFWPFGYARLILFPSSCCPMIFRKSQKTVSVYSRCLWNGIKNSGLSVFLPLPLILALQRLSTTFLHPTLFLARTHAWMTRFIFAVFFHWGDPILSRSRPTSYWQCWKFPINFRKVCLDSKRNFSPIWDVKQNCPMSSRTWYLHLKLWCYFSTSGETFGPNSCLRSPSKYMYRPIIKLDNTWNMYALLK